MFKGSDGGGQNILDVIHEWSLVVAAAHGGAVGGLALGDRRRGGGRGRAAVRGVRRTALLAAPEMCKSRCQFHLPTKNKINLLCFSPGGVSLGPSCVRDEGEGLDEDGEEGEGRRQQGVLVEELDPGVGAGVPARIQDQDDYLCLGKTFGENFDRKLQNSRVKTISKVLIYPIPRGFSVCNSLNESGLYTPFII